MALTTVPASLSATALTLTTAAQPNITSVGTLTGLTVSGNIAGTLTTAAQTNITSLGTLSALTVTGTSTLGVVDASSFTDVITNTIYTQSGNLDIDTVLTGRDVTFTQGSTALMTIKGDASGTTVTGTLGVGTNASSVIGVYSTKSLANGLAAELSNTESSTGSGLVVKGGNNSSTYSADFRDYNSNSLMRVRGDGNVGIGTTNPNTNLQLYHATDDISINVNHGTGGSYPKKSGISFGAISTSLGGDATFTGGAGIQVTNTAATNNPTEMAFFTTSGGAPTTRMLINSDGNVGIGVTPPAWYTGGSLKSLQVGSSTALFNLFGTRTVLADNYYLQTGTGTDKYITTNEASQYYQEAGKHRFFHAASGSAGATISWTESMHIDANGNVGIGTNNPTTHLSVTNSGFSNTSTTGIPAIRTEGNYGGAIGLLDTKEAGWYAQDSGDTLYQYVGRTVGSNAPNANIVMTYKSSGNVGIGITNPLSPLSVQASSTAAGMRFIGRSSDSISSIGFYNSGQTADTYYQSNSSWQRARADGGFHYRKGNTPTVTDVDGFTIEDMNVGIRTANPSEALEVYGSINSTYQSNNFATGAQRGVLDIINSSKIVRVGSVAGAATPSGDQGSVSFLVNSSERKKLASGGGIGVDTPSAIRTDTTFTGASGHATKRWGFGAGRQASSAPFYVINESNAGVYIGFGNQSWTAHSDERIKENVTSVGTVLPSLMNMQCVKYNLKTDPGNTKIGFIAQDWETNFPEVVDEQSDMVLESDGSIAMAHSSESTTIVKGLSYTETIPLLLKAIQEQQAMIETLQAEVTALKG